MGIKLRLPESISSYVEMNVVFLNHAFAMHAKMSRWSFLKILPKESLWDKKKFDSWKKMYASFLPRNALQTYCSFVDTAYWLNGKKYFSHSEKVQMTRIFKMHKFNPDFNSSKIWNKSQVILSKVCRYINKFYNWWCKIDCISIIQSILLTLTYIQVL